MNDRTFRHVALSLMLSSLITISAISWNFIAQHVFAQSDVSGSTIYADITIEAANKSDDAYTPNPIRASVGDTVVWTNNDSTIHTVTAGTPTEGATGEFGGTQENPELIFAGGTFEHTFEEEGEYPYWCTLHPAMVGTVIVSGSDDDSPNIDDLSSDKSSYTLGETVNLLGRVSGGDMNQYLTLTVTNSAGGIFKVDQFRPDTDGSFSYTFILSGANAIPGSWSVLVGYGAQSATTSFNVNDDDNDDTTSLPLIIETPIMTDVSGGPVERVQLGSQAIISVGVDNTEFSTQPLTLIVQIEGTDGITDHLSWQSTSIVGGQSINTGFAWTPSAQGSYEIKVFAWENLSAPTPLADPKTLNVSVISSN